MCPNRGYNTLKNILVVEDEPASLELLSHFLRKEGYRVSEASDGAKAIELLDNQPFDLVLTDIRMPRLDGVTLCDAYTFQITSHSYHHDDGFSFRGS